MRGEYACTTRCTRTYTAWHGGKIKTCMKEERESVGYNGMNTTTDRHHIWASKDGTKKRKARVGGVRVQRTLLLFRFVVHPTTVIVHFDPGAETYLKIIQEEFCLCHIFVLHRIDYRRGFFFSIQIRVSLRLCKQPPSISEKMGWPSMPPLSLLSPPLEKWPLPDLLLPVWLLLWAEKARKDTVVL